VVLFFVLQAFPSPQHTLRQAKSNLREKYFVENILLAGFMPFPALAAHTYLDLQKKLLSQQRSIAWNLIAVAPGLMERIDDADSCFIYTLAIHIQVTGVANMLNLIWKH